MTNDSCLKSSSVKQQSSVPAPLHNVKHKYTVQMLYMWTNVLVLPSQYLVQLLF